MNVFGLDIGSHNLKIAQVVQQGKKPKLVAVGISQAPQPGLSSEAETDLVTLATAIKKLCQDGKVSTKRVVVGISESQIYSRVIELPKMSDDELSAAIPWEAEQIIPLPLSEVTLDWQVVGKVASAGEVEKIKVFVVAAPLSLIEKYQKVLELAGLEIVAIETEILAAARALVPPSSPPLILLDFGGQTTSLAIVDKGQVTFTRCLPTAGEAFTRAISTSLAMEMPQAEQYKIAYGMEEGQLEGKVKKAITPVFEVVISEIKKAMVYWNEKEKEMIKNIILIGGSAVLPQAATILTKSFGLEVQVGDPLRALIVDEKLASPIREKASTLAVAVGLSMKEF